jgi:hypothetical protein
MVDGPLRAMTPLVALTLRGPVAVAALHSQMWKKLRSTEKH